MFNLLELDRLSNWAPERLGSISHNSVVLLGEQGTKPRIQQRVFVRGITHSSNLEEEANTEAALQKARQGYGGPNYKYSVEEYQQTQSAWPIHLMMVVLFGATIWQSYKVFSKKGFPWQQGYTLRDLGQLLPSPREPK